MTFRASTVVAVAMLALCGTAFAGPKLDHASAAYDRVEYAEAIRLLEEALSSEPLTAGELEHAYAMLGSSLLGDGQAERAERAYRTLLALRPDYHAEPNAPPKVVEMLRRVRGQAAVAEPTIVPDPLPSFSVRAEMAAAAPLHPAVEYVVDGHAVRARLSCNGARCEIQLPALTDSYRLGFLTDENAFALATSEMKLTAPRVVDTGRKTPVYKKWWLWTIVGVVVVGGVTGAAVGVTLSQRAAHSIDFAIKKDCGSPELCNLWGP